MLSDMEQFLKRSLKESMNCISLFFLKAYMIMHIMKEYPNY